VATDTRTFIDTDVLIDIGRKNLRALDFWRRAEARSAMTCSIISVFKLLAGCRNLREQRATLRSLATVEVIQVESGDSSQALY
jgi:predicted nucleic acid-binding protein